MEVLVILEANVGGGDFLVADTAYQSGRGVVLLAVEMAVDKHIA